MAIGLWKKPYTLRSFGEQKHIKGYASASITDRTVKLDVQILGSDDLSVQPEGESSIKSIVTYGGSRIIAADEFQGIRGDLLWYRDHWYECVASFLHENTLLRHYRSEFVIIPQAQQPNPPTQPKGADDT